MMLKLKWAVIIICFVACKEPFAPVLPSGNRGLLVVEGYINMAGTTTIKLSRTLELGDTSLRKAEAGARVSIESEAHSVLNLHEAPAGIYNNNTGILDKRAKYRLYIKTATGGEYATDYSEPIMTPDIDSIFYRIEKDSLKLFFNTHDPYNKVNYYRWDYRETWAVHTLYKSLYIYDNQGEAKKRDTSQNIKDCWGNEATAPADILLGSTAALNPKVIKNYHLPSFPLTSERLSDLFSVEVTQYGLSENGYNYLQNLKKNTDQLGGIYDAQPSEFESNVHSLTDIQEKVIGYVETGIVQKKRIFIHREDLDLSDWFNFILPSCPIETISAPQSDAFIRLIQEGYGIIDEPAGSLRLSPLGCIDCTIKGSNIKPDFWPE